MDKKTCDNCDKKDCQKCVEEDGKTFCCGDCCEKYKNKKEEQKKEEPANVCRFC